MKTLNGLLADNRTFIDRRSFVVWWQSDHCVENLFCFSSENKKRSVDTYARLIRDAATIHNLAALKRWVRERYPEAYDRQHVWVEPHTWGKAAVEALWATYLHWRDEQPEGLVDVQTLPRPELVIDVIEEF